MVEYNVTDKYIIKSTDNNCINQNTNGEKEITLLTCNYDGEKRLVVKARAKS